ncbi:hypothetical protein ACJQWK_05814 [Exserohilum turcicum]
MEPENPRPTKKRQLAAQERQRAVRACDECRRLKEKCEGGTPCKRCRHLRRPCEFNNPSTVTWRRGADSAALLKELKDRVKYMEAILRHHLPRINLDVEALRQTCESLPSWPDLGQSSVPAMPLEPAVAPPASESPGIEDENCTVEYVDDTTAHYSGEFSHWNFSMHIKRNIDDLISKSNVKTLESIERIPDFYRVAEPDPASTSIRDLVATLPPRPVSAFLANVFFTRATSIYYYVDSNWVKETLDHLHRNSAHLSSKDVPAACVVLMVLAVGTQYVHLETSKQNNNKCGRRGPANLETPVNWELDIGCTFYRQAAKSISEVIHSGSLLSVQVFLLLALYNLPIDASGLGFVYSNLAIKVAIQNGMHRRLSRGVFDTKAKEMRRRIWWTAYCIERKIGIYHGRPASIQRSDIDADFPTSFHTSGIDDDDFDATGLLESIHLTCQAEAFLYQISQLRTCPRSEAGTIMDRITQMKTKLQRPWAARHQNVDHLASRAALHARLECCLLHIFIGRPFVLAHRQVRPDNQHRDPNATEHVSRAPKATAANSQIRWNVLIDECVSAANEAIDICSGMQTGGMGLARSSYTEYSACRASLLVLIAYSICRRTNDFSNNLQKGLDAIREMASVGDSARSEVSLLETLEQALHRLQDFNVECDDGAEDAVGESVQASYQGLLDWYTKAAGCINPRASTSIPTAMDSHGARAPVLAPHPQPGPHGNEFPAAGAADGPGIDEYPFDLDLLNMDGNIAFFTSDFNDHGIVESELFENLLCMPR